MASSSDESDKAAERLEAALERIAQAARAAAAREAAARDAAVRAATAQVQQSVVTVPQGVPATEIAVRLDNLIDRLRGVLDGNAA